MKFNSFVRFILVGTLGLIGTLSLLILINSSFLNFNKSQEVKKVVKFEIKKSKKIKKLSQIKKKNKIKNQNKFKPNLRSIMSGMSFGIPAFEMDLTSGSDFLSQGAYMNGAKVDQKPKVLFRSELSFPEEALSSNKSGYVTFGVFIDENGKIKKIDILDSHPKGLFEKAAMSSLKKWKFKPAVHKGIKVATWQEQKIIFNAEAS